MIYIFDIIGAITLITALALMKYRWAWLLYFAACMCYLAVGVGKGLPGLIIVEIVAGSLGLRNYFKKEK